MVMLCYVMLLISYVKNNNCVVMWSQIYEFRYELLRCWKNVDTFHKIMDVSITM